MFGKLGTWWDHRPLWQKIGLGLGAAAGAAVAAPAMLGGGAAAGASAVPAASAATGLGAFTPAELAAISAAAPTAGSIAPVASGAGIGVMSSAPAHLSTLGYMRGLLAAHPGYVKYGKIAAANGYSMYDDAAKKAEAAREQRKMLAQQMMAMVSSQGNPMLRPMSMMDRGGFADQPPPQDAGAYRGGPY